MPDAEHHVLYKAVADFSDLILKAAKAKAELEALQNSANRTVGSGISDADRQRIDNLTKAAKNRTTAESETTQELRRQKQATDDLVRTENARAQQQRQDRAAEAAAMVTAELRKQKQATDDLVRTTESAAKVRRADRAQTEKELRAQQELEQDLFHERETHEAKLANLGEVNAANKRTVNARASKAEDDARAAAAKADQARTTRDATRIVQTVKVLNAEESLTQATEKTRRVSAQANTEEARLHNTALRGLQSESREQRSIEASGRAAETHMARMIRYAQIIQGNRDKNKGSLLADLFAVPVSALGNFGKAVDEAIRGKGVLEAARGGLKGFLKDLFQGDLTPFKQFGRTIEDAFSNAFKLAPAKVSVGDSAAFIRSQIGGIGKEVQNTARQDFAALKGIIGSSGQQAATEAQGLFARISRAWKQTSADLSGVNPFRRIAGWVKDVGSELGKSNIFAGIRNEFKKFQDDLTAAGRSGAARTWRTAIGTPIREVEGLVNSLRNSWRRMGAELAASGAGGGGSGLIKKLLTDLGNLGNSIGGVFSGIGKHIFSFASLIAAAVASAAPLIAGLGALSAAALGLVNNFASLSGASLALPGLFAAAATAVGALYIALRPLKDVLTAYTQTQRSAAQASQQLLDAQHSEQQAQLSLTEARKQAIRNLEDLRNAVRNASLDEAGARLALQQAQLDYQKTLANPNATLLDRQEALLHVKQAENDLYNVQVKNKRNLQDYTTAVKQGVNGNPQVVQAAYDLIKAQKQLAAGGAEAYTAQQNLQASLSKLGPNARAVALALLGQAGAWLSIKRTIGDNFFAPLVAQIGKLPDLLSTVNTLLGKSATAVGTLVSKAIDRLTSASWKTDFDTLAAANANIINTLGDAALSIADALRNITIAAAPFAQWVAKAIKDTADSFAHWAQSARDSGQLSRFLDHTEKTMRDVWRIAKDLGAVFVSLFVGTQGFADAQLTSIGAVTDKWAAWAKTQERAGSSLRNWLTNVGGALSSVVGLAGALAKAIGQIAADPANLHEAKSIFDTLANIVLPALVRIFHALSASHVISDIVTAIGRLATALGNFLSHGGVTPITAFLSTLEKGFRLLARALGTPVIAQAISAIGVALGTLAGVAILSKFSALFKLYELLSNFRKLKAGDLNLKGLFEKTFGIGDAKDGGLAAGGTSLEKAAASLQSSALALKEAAAALSRVAVEEAATTPAAGTLAAQEAAAGEAAAGTTAAEAAAGVGLGSATTGTRSVISTGATTALEDAALAGGATTAAGKTGPLSRLWQRLRGVTSTGDAGGSLFTGRGTIAGQEAAAATAATATAEASQSRSLFPFLFRSSAATAAESAAGGSLLSRGASRLFGATGSGLIPLAAGLGTNAVTDTGAFGKPGSTGYAGGKIIGDTLTGAGIGAMLGSIVPGVGNVVGAGIGGLAGLLKGFLFDSDNTKKFSEGPADPGFKDKRIWNTFLSGRVAAQGTPFGAQLDNISAVQTYGLPSTGAFGSRGLGHDAAQSIGGLAAVNALTGDKRASQADTGVAFDKTLKDIATDSGVAQAKLAGYAIVVDQINKANLSGQQKADFYSKALTDIGSAGGDAKATLDSYLYTLNQVDKSNLTASQRADLYSQAITQVGDSAFSANDKLDGLGAIVAKVNSSTLPGAQKADLYSQALDQIGQSSGDASKKLADYNAVLQGITSANIDANTKLDLYSKTLDGLGAIADGAKGKLDSIGKTFWDIANAQGDAATKADLLEKAWQDAFGGADTKQNLVDNFNLAFDRLTENQNKVKYSIKDTSSAAIESQQNIRDAAIASRKLWEQDIAAANGDKKKIAEANREYDKRNQKLVTAASAYTKTKAEAQKLVDLQTRHWPKEVKTKVTIDDSAALGTLQQIYNKLVDNWIAQYAFDHHISLNEAVVVYNDSHGHSTGEHSGPGKASGDIVEGTYDGRSDTKPIWATVGEFITRKRVVDKPLGKEVLRALNEEQIDPADLYAALSANVRATALPSVLTGSAMARSGPRHTVTNSHRTVNFGDFTINNPIRERSERSARRALQTAAILADR